VLKTSFPSSRKALSLSSFEDHFEPSALLTEGGVARLVWANKAMYLALFNAHGQLQTRTKLDPPSFVPYGIAVFRSGELLVSGLEHVHSVRALSSSKIFIALYDKDGHLQKRLSLSEDPQIEAAAEIGDARYARGPMFGNDAVSYGRVRLGEDGNAYLMRRTLPGDRVRNFFFRRTLAHFDDRTGGSWADAGRYASRRWAYRGAV